MHLNLRSILALAIFPPNVIHLFSANQSVTDARLRRVKSAKGRGWLPCTGAPSKACQVSRLTQAARRRAQVGGGGRLVRGCWVGRALSRLQEQETCECLLAV